LRWSCCAESPGKQKPRKRAAVHRRCNCRGKSALILKWKNGILMKVMN